MALTQRERERERVFTSWPAQNSIIDFRNSSAARERHCGRWVFFQEKHHSRPNHSRPRAGRPLLLLLTSSWVQASVEIRQEFSDFFSFSRGRRRQGVEVFEETGPRKAGRAKVPFDNFDPENYFRDVGLRNAAARGASPVTAAHGVKNALSGDSDLGLEHRHSTHTSHFLGQRASFSNFRQFSTGQQTTRPGKWPLGDLNRHVSRFESPLAASRRRWRRREGSNL